MESTTSAALAQPSLPLGVRLVPALIHGQRVHLECPIWCVTDHVAENERHLEDVAHAGPLTDLAVPGGDPFYRLLAHARLGLDNYAPRPEDRVPVVVIDDGSEGHHLSPGEADEFADRLIAFAVTVRALARVAGDRGVAGRDAAGAGLEGAA
ncbi:hypothetical protein AB0M57_04540 [Streptomyces sp. NPDC051597]|uniref:DUF6907 domain-containing protein n=1 Tax=Streptomyces sp. NPDC051597 TaxID=3155049 RepID=UPI003439B6D8